MPYESYIWNLNNPNVPEKTLSPPSPLCTAVFNPKATNILVGGCYNGSLCLFDLSKGNSSGVVTPAIKTVLEKSHHDPVYDIYWLTHTKQNYDCVSTSTDGRILWWDMRNPQAPVDTFTIEQEIDGKGNKILGGTRLDYNMEAGASKYLVSTEQGYTFLVNKKQTGQNSTKIEILNRYGLNGGKHHGPVYALERNPSISKYFLTVGDWTAKVWSEE